MLAAETALACRGGEGGVEAWRAYVQGCEEGWEKFWEGAEKFFIDAGIGLAEGWLLGRQESEEEDTLVWKRER